MWLNFSQVTKSFVELFLRDVPVRILIYSNPKILRISFLQHFLASVIKFFSSYKRFRRAVFKRRSCNSKNFWFFSCIYLKQLPLIPKSIFTGEYQQHQYTCFFILAFRIQLNMLYICADEIYISNQCISSIIISAILQYFLKCC